MSQLIKWFSSDKSEKQPIDKSNNPTPPPSAADQMLVESCLSSLPRESLSSGDYFRLYHTLLDWSREKKATSKFARRTALNLLISHFTGHLPSGAYTPAYLSKMLQITGLSVEIARWLVRTFPSISALAIDVHPSGDDLNPSALVALLFEPSGSCWARRLTKFEFQGSAVPWFTLLPKLTEVNFPNLKRLVVICAESLGPICLPILRQLTDFRIFTDDLFSAIWQTIKVNINEQPPVDTKRIYLFHMRLASPLLYEVLCMMMPHVAADVRELCVEVPPPEDGSSPSVLGSLVAKFHSLTTLTLLTSPTTGVGRFTLVQLLKPLVQLKTLKFLNLSLHSHKQLPAAHDVELTNGSKLIQVKEVLIKVMEVGHGTFYAPVILGGLFPAARPVGVNFGHCVTCKGLESPVRPLRFMEESRLEDVNGCWEHVIVDAQDGDIYYEMRNFFN